MNKNKKNIVKRFKPNTLDEFRSGTKLFNVEILYNEKFSIVTKNIKIAEDLHLSKASITQVSKKITQFIRDLHSELIYGIAQSDQIFCAIFHPELDIPIGIRFMPRVDFTEQLLQNEIIKVCLSLSIS